MTEARTDAMRISKSPDRIDRILTWAVVALLALFLSGSGWFGYTYWLDRQAEGSSSPALRAIQGLEKVVKKNPNNAGVRVRYGEALATAGLYDEAVTAFNRAIELDPKHSGAYLDLGLVAMSQEQPDDARKYFLKVLDLTKDQDYSELNQRREKALFHLGEIAVGAEQYEDALGYLKEALRMRKDASDTYYYAGIAYRGLDDLDAAERSLKVALTFDPNYAAAHYEMGLIYLEREQPASAAAEFRRVLTTNPDSEQAEEALEAMGRPEDWVAKASKSLASGDLQMAEQYAYVATAIDPKHFPAVMLYAQALEQTGEKDKAREQYEVARALRPGDAGVEEALARLKD